MVINKIAFNNYYNSSFQIVCILYTKMKSKRFLITISMIMLSYSNNSEGSDPVNI